VCVTGYPEGMADQTTNGSLSNLSNEFSNHRLSSTVRGQHGQHALLSLVPSSPVAPLALTRLTQRWRAIIRIQSGVALSTAVRGVYFTLAGPMEDRSVNIGPTPIDAVCPRDTLGTRQSRRFDP